MVDRLIWKDQEILPLCLCVYSWVGGKDVLDSDIYAGRQRFSVFFSGWIFFLTEGGVFQFFRVSGTFLRIYRHQMKIKFTSGSNKLIEGLHYEFCLKMKQGIAVDGSNTSMIGR